MKTTETTNSAIGPVSGRCYSELQIEQTKIDVSIQKPGAEVPTLPPGQQPFNPANIWNIDRAPVPTIAADPDAGPSGVLP